MKKDKDTNIILAIIGWSMVFLLIKYSGGPFATIFVFGVFILGAHNTLEIIKSKKKKLMAKIGLELYR